MPRRRAPPTHFHAQRHESGNVCVRVHPRLLRRVPPPCVAGLPPTLYIYIYLYVYTHRYMYVYIHIYIYICRISPSCVAGLPRLYIYKCIFVHIYIYVYTHICIYVYVIYICIHTPHTAVLCHRSPHPYVYIYIHPYTYIYIYVYTQGGNVDTHTYIVGTQT